MVEHLAKPQYPDITNQLELEKCGSAPISGGGFGDVYRGALKGGEHVAIKCGRLYLERSEAKQNTALKVRLRESKLLSDFHVARHLYVWSRLKHDNILQLLGVAQFRDHIAMISPWMDHGNLLEYLERNPTADRYRLLIGIVNGVVYLHQNNTVHGEIKSSNVLISREGVVKVAGFGQADLEKSTRLSSSSGNRLGSPVRWMAPEIIDGSVTHATEESDVYALGMTLLEVVTGKMPFYYQTETAVLVAVSLRRQTPDRPNDFPSFQESEAILLWNIILGCLAYDYADRPASNIVRNLLERLKQSTTESSFYSAKESLPRVESPGGPDPRLAGFDKHLSGDAATKVTSTMVRATNLNQPHMTAG
ncbi:hypothetical protein FRC07_014803 [Ceratobasidium sp. 392]|nr:hypothetical protein FRC07_014803 [Ceratobasidium sp. 392]